MIDLSTKVHKITSVALFVDPIEATWVLPRRLRDYPHVVKKFDFWSTKAIVIINKNKKPKTNI